MERGALRGEWVNLFQWFFASPLAAAGGNSRRAYATSLLGSKFPNTIKMPRRHTPMTQRRAQHACRSAF